MAKYRAIRVYSNIDELFVFEIQNLNLKMVQIISNKSKISNNMKHFE